MPSAMADNLDRASVYRFLARLWAEEPGELLAELATEPLRTVWKQLGGNVPNLASDRDQSSINEDYCRLFIGPKGHLPPIQSVWTRGELDTSTTASLREFDAIVGFAGPWKFSIIPDHLGNELWAMSQILVKSDGLAVDDQIVAEDLARQFFTGHLNWTDNFLEAVIQREGEQFYGTLAAITRQFLKDEAARFAIAVT